MAGQFVIWRLKGGQDVADDLFAHYGGTSWSAVAHEAGVVGGGGHVFQGWNANTTQVLNGIRNGSANPANRNNLPPHKYLQFPGGAPTAAQRAYLLTCELIFDLERPSSEGFGVVALCPNAASKWNAGDRGAALIAQVTHGATSIEVYYVGSKRVE